MFRNINPKEIAMIPAPKGEIFADIYFPFRACQLPDFSIDIRLEPTGFRTFPRCIRSKLEIFGLTAGAELITAFDGPLIPLACVSLHLPDSAALGRTCYLFR